MAKQLKITQIRSTIRRIKNQKITLRHLGVCRMHHTVLQPDNPQIRGMIRKVEHLVSVEEVNG